MFESKVILLEKSITELVIKLDTFMCMENSGEDSIDTVTDVTEEVIATEPLKQKEAVDKFPCHLCDFESNRPNGLVIHIGRKHNKKNMSSNIGQFDGNASIATIGTNDIDDELFKRTEHYWKNGWLGISDRDFVDATNIIDESDLDEEDKKREKDALVCARKDAFMERGTPSFFYLPTCASPQ